MTEYKNVGTRLVYLCNVCIYAKIINRNTETQGNKQNAKKGQYIMTEAAKAARREYHRRRRENMTEEQREALRAYHSKWQHDNPDKVRAATARYWERKAAEQAAEQGN